MDAVILAGGFGTRLQGVVKDVPKPMAPMGEANGNKPFLALLLRHLATHGITRVVLATHHMHDVIESYFGNTYAGIELVYAREATPLFAGGAIVNAIHTANLTQPLFVLNGDTFIGTDYQALAAQHKATNADLTMVLRHIPDTGRSGVVTVDADNRITSFGTRGETNKPGLINAGVWMMNPSLLSEYKIGEPFSFEQHFLQPRIPHKLKPHALITDGYFIDIGVPDDYARAQAELAQHL